MITADHNYGTKDLHGLRWGISVFVNDQKKTALTEMGGSLERLHNQDLSLVQGRDLLVFGNIWVHKDAEEKTKFRHPDLYKEWYLTEIRARYNDIFYKIEELAEIIGYDISHLVGQLNFTKEEQASMDSFREKNARGPVAADGWEGY